MENNNEQAQNTTDIVVLKEKNLTISKHTVNKKDLPNYWEQEEMVEIIETIENYQHKMLIQFLRITGCRVTEALNIRKKDIDFRSFTIQIRWLKSRKYHNRIIPMHPTLRNMLDVYTATMNESDKVFPITRQRAWQIIQKYFKGNPHKFRHSFAVHWLRSEGDIVTLSRILGHSDVKTTMVYLQIVPIDQGKELIKLQF